MVLAVRFWGHMSGYAGKEIYNFLRISIPSSRHHAAVILPLSSPFVELLVSFNDLAFCTTETIAIEDRAAAYAHMPRHDLFPFALT